MNAFKPSFFSIIFSCNLHHTLTSSKYSTHEQTSPSVDDTPTVCIRVSDWTLLKVPRWLFVCHFCPLLMWANIFVAVCSLPEIGFNLKLNHHIQVKLIQIPATHCIRNLDWTLVKVTRWWLLWHFLTTLAATLGATRSLPEMGLSLWPKHYNQVQLFQILDTYCKKGLS